MATIKKSYDEINTFRLAAQQWINKNPERTRFHYALEKLLNRTKVHSEDYADKENDIRVECALLDDKKAFTYIEVEGPMGPQKNLATDPAKAKEQQKRMRELGRTKIEIEQYFAPAPDKLQALWHQHFLGFVLDESKDEMADKKTEEPKMELQKEQPE